MGPMGVCACVVGTALGAGLLGSIRPNARPQVPLGAGAVRIAGAALEARCLSTGGPCPFDPCSGGGAESPDRTSALSRSRHATEGDPIGAVRGIFGRFDSSGS